MQTIKKLKISIYSGILLCSVLFCSCVATNNMYVNDPKPLQKGDADICVGVGTGLGVVLDSSLSGNTYNTAIKTQYAPVLSFNGQFGVGERFNLRAAVHLPYILGGIGLRFGAQYSLFGPESRFNAAIGSDLGLVFTRDSLWIIDIESDSRGIYNIDVFLPLSYSFTEDFSIILTPRYSVDWVSVDDIHDKDKSSIFYSHFPVLTLGIKIKDFYLESSALYNDDMIYPHFGLGFIFEM